MVPSTRSTAINGIRPSLEATAFVAPDCAVVGDVEVGAGSSLWYGAVLRGDAKQGVKIGANSNIQDRAMVQASAKGGAVIGSNVTVGAGATVESATLADNCMVGAGATVEAGVTVETNAVVAPGSVVEAGKTVAAGTLWAGNPAAELRALTADEIAAIGEAATFSAEMGAAYEAEVSKTWQEIEADKETRKLRAEIGDHYMYNPLSNDMPDRPGLVFDQDPKATEVTYSQRKTGDFYNTPPNLPSNVSHSDSHGSSVERAHQSSA